MAKSSAISIVWKLEGDAQNLRKLIADAEGLKKAFASTAVEADRMTKSWVNSAALSNSVDHVTKTVNQLRDVMAGWSDAYAVQQQAETQLEVAMRNRMKATTEDIQAIKDLCSAQQALGVIGDEIQLAGAQELATYTEKRRSLEQLIPVMNDMAAQQYGLNASSENMASIASTLGKALNGNVKILERQGYKFSESQKAMIEHGTEGQRVAAIVEAISAQVGGMNQKLAQTDSGRMKQLNNALGDVKEKLGSMVQGALPFVTIASHVATTTGGVIKLVQGTKTATAAMRTFGKVTRSAIVTTGVGVAIVAITTLINKLMHTTSDAADEFDELADAEKRAARAEEFRRAVMDEGQNAYDNANIKIQGYITQIKNFQGSEIESRRLVKELNGAFGDRMGDFSNLHDWYNKLITDSSKYCEAMRLEAENASLMRERNRISDYITNLDKDEAGSKRMYSYSDSKGIQLGAGYYFNKFRKIGDKAIPVDGRGLRTSLARPWEELEGSLRQGKGSQSEYYFYTPGSSLDKTNTNIKTAQGNISKIDEQITANNLKMASLTAGLFTGSEHTPNFGGGTSVTPPTDTSKHEAQYRANAAAVSEWRENISALNLQLEQLGTDTASLERAAAINKEIAETQAKIDQVRNAGKEQELTATYIEEAKSIDDVNNNLAILHKELSKATTDEERVRINGLIEKNEQLIQSWSQMGRSAQEAKTSTLQLIENYSTLGEIQNNIAYWQEQLAGSTKEQAQAIREKIKALQEESKAWDDNTKGQMNAYEALRSGYSSIKNVVSGAQDLGKVLKGGEDAWTTITTAMDAAFTIADGIIAIVNLVKMFTGVSEASAVATTASTTATTASTVADTAHAAAQPAVIAANKVATASWLELAAAQLFAANAALPIVGYGIATGQVTAMATLVKSLGFMAFAEGGVVSGPTLGLIGEYSGAVNNPEVVAPLSKLKTLIGDTGAYPDKIELVLKGRTAVGLIQKEARHTSRM